MKTPGPVGRHLVWLLFQTLMLMPMVLGQGVLQELPATSVGTWCSRPFTVRNVVRLWRAPSAEAGAWTAIPLLIVGVLLLLMSSGPLLEDERISTKPMGVALLIMGVILVFFGLRDALRIRSRRTAAPAL